MNIDYYTFKEDCKLIIEPFLAKYGYNLDDRVDYEVSKEYENYYTNDNNIIQVTMLSSFPRIGVSCHFKTLDNKHFDEKIIDNYFFVNEKDFMKFYIEFENKDLDDILTQMRYAVAVMEKFYKPLLTGEVKLEEIIESSNKNV